MCNCTSRGRGSKRSRLVVRRLPLARLAANRLLRTCRTDAEGPSRGGGRALGLRVGSEVYPAARRELRFVPDHAGRDAVDIRNVGAAKPESIVAAGLLLLRGVGPACRRPHRNREHHCQHQAELEVPGPGSKHVSPRSVAFLELWVNGGGMARKTRRPISTCHGKRGAHFFPQEVPGRFASSLTTSAVPRICAGSRFGHCPTRCYAVRGMCME